MRGLGRRIVMLVVLAATGASSLNGQTAPQIGARLRLWMRASNQLADGYYVRADRDTVTISPLHEGGEGRFAWGELRLIEQRVNAERHALLGAGVGAGFGGLVGAIFGSRMDVGEVHVGALAGALLGAALGTGAGALVGYLTRTEKWRPLELWSNASGAFGVVLWKINLGYN